MLLQIRLSNELQSCLFRRCMRHSWSHHGGYLSWRPWRVLQETTFAVPTYLFKLLMLRWLVRTTSCTSCYFLPGVPQILLFHGESQRHRPPLLNGSIIVCMGRDKPVTVPLHLVRHLTRHFWIEWNGTVCSRHLMPCWCILVCDW